MKEGNIQKIVSWINVLVPLIMFIVAWSILEDKTIIYFLGSIWLMFVIVPRIIAKNTEWGLKKRDIFSYKYSDPLITGILIGGLFLISNYQEGRWWVITIIFVFLLMYALNHLYMSRKYPEYYFEK